MKTEEEIKEAIEWFKMMQKEYPKAFNGAFEYGRIVSLEWVLK